MDRPYTALSALPMRPQPRFNEAEAVA